MFIFDILMTLLKASINICKLYRKMDITCRS